MQHPFTGAVLLSFHAVVAAKKMFIAQIGSEPQSQIESRFIALELIYVDHSCELKPAKTLVFTTPG